MKANKQSQTIEMHFRYNKRKKKIYDTAVSPKPSTRYGAKVKILSKKSSIARAFNYTLPVALKIYGYNCAYKSTMSEFSSCHRQAHVTVPKNYALYFTIDEKCFAWETIKNPQKYAGQTMIVGSVTDAYNPQEEIFRRTRAFLEQMQGSGINLIITTKSDLVLRDLNLIKTFPSPLISWSINTLDENFKNDMDRAVSIERRIAAMKKCHEAGIRTTCFISPIFPEITEVFEIIERIKDFCDYIWLENLNLRSNFKAQIMEYIGDKYTELLPLYQQIYNKNDMTYWQVLDCKMAEYAEANGFLYVIDEEPFLRNPTGKPIIINYFYHSQIKQTAKKK